MDAELAGRGTLLIICLASAAWAFSFGLGAPLAALWLADRGLNNQLTGLNTSLYYLGIALAAPFIPALMRGWGRTCIIGGMLVDGVTVVLFPWAGGKAAWFGLRFLCGTGTALCLIPLETQVNHNAPTNRRARDFGLYATSVALGIGLGPLVGLPLYRHAPHLAFALGGLATLAGALLLLLLPSTAAQELTDTSTASPGFLVSLPSLSTAWVQGFLEGGMMTFLSLYLLGLHYTESGVSGLLGALFLGVIVFQIPVAWLADRFGRLRLLLICDAVVLAGLGALAWLTGPVGLAAWLFAVGACCAALYPLGLALLGEQVPPAALARANAWYLASNCCGSLSGPVLIGLAMDFFGNKAMFPAAAAALVLAAAIGGLARLHPAALVSARQDAKSLHPV